MTNVVKQLGLVASICAMLIAALGVTGCASTNVSSGAEMDAAATGETVVENPDNPDRLRPGDNLMIYFSDLPGERQAPFEGPIREDGTITLLQNQSFMAAGKTRGQLEKEIRERYVPRLFLHMTVTIKPQDRFYFVGGEVKSPGRQIYLGKMTVIKAIQSAGDFTEFANKKGVIVYRIDGRRQVVNVTKAYKDPSLDVEVFPGDKLHVPRKWL